MNSEKPIRYTFSNRKKKPLEIRSSKKYYTNDRPETETVEVILTLSKPKEGLCAFCGYRRLLVAIDSQHIQLVCKECFEKYEGGDYV